VSTGKLNHIMFNYAYTISSQILLCSLFINHSVIRGYVVELLIILLNKQEINIKFNYVRGLKIDYHSVFIALHYFTAVTPKLCPAQRWVHEISQDSFSE
jgi:hypothetical protein